jgi:hypothetical protein
MAGTYNIDLSSNEIQLLNEIRFSFRVINKIAEHYKCENLIVACCALADRLKIFLRY